MPTNNFKLFDEKKANMMTDEEYAINQQRLNGVQSGVASSQLQNKTLYQTALMCYALAQLMAANGYDANDADAVSTFVNNMSASMVQKVVDKAKASDIVSKTVGKWIDSAQFGALKDSVDKDFLKLSGGTMLGNLILNADPTQNLQAATKQYVDGKDLLLYTGKYIGTGKYGQSNPITLTFPFVPIILIGPFTTGYFTPTAPIVLTPFDSLNSLYWRESGRLVYIKRDGGKVSWYSEENSTSQFNDSGVIYYYAAIGGYDIGEDYERIITTSGDFIVPNSGKYYIELYGGGGGMVAGSYRRTGSSSCQVYNSVTLQKGDKLTVSIGIAGDGTSQPTGTSFGNYHVDGGKNGENSTIVSGSGNKGTQGQTGLMQYNIKNPSTGLCGNDYGYGINAYSGNEKGVGGPGAVYFKYLGE